MSEAAGAVVTWLWDKYGKDLTDKALGEVKKQLSRFKWQEAEVNYRSRLYAEHRYTRLLGNPKPIEIENIYTDVYVLDQPTALRRYSFEHIHTNVKTREDFSSIIESNRRPLIRLAINEKRLYLLGKPGAGKTTFLRYLTLQACAGKIRETPIMVDLKDWAASGLELMPYMVRQFEICAFPDAQAFIKHLLVNGHALVLFDGLDEVNQEDEQQAKKIRVIKDFARQYPDTHICLTCRIAASDYSFEQFTYLEIADFSEQQVEQFSRKWYQDEPEKGERFLAELSNPVNEGLKELTSTPLLLAMLCLAFDQTSTFPNNRTELYREALEALLKKWDATREIHRDRIYHGLTPVVREKLLAYLAAENFEKSAYFMRDTLLASQIIAYLKPLPVLETDGPLDGEVILKAIEAQHGILVERAHNIYSFSHLTLQEYLTARHIVVKVGSGSVERLIHGHLTDNRWREIFLITASMLDDASTFFEEFLSAIGDLLLSSPDCLSLFQWANRIAQSKTFSKSALLIIIALALVHNLNNYEDIDYGIDFNIDLIISFALDLATEPKLILDLNYALQRARFLDLGLAEGSERIRPRIFTLIQMLNYILQRNFGLKVQSEERDWNLIKKMDQLTCYLEVNRLLLDCLKLAVEPDRASIIARMLIPPTGNVSNMATTKYY